MTTMRHTVWLTEEHPVSDEHRDYSLRVPSPYNRLTIEVPSLDEGFSKEEEKCLSLWAQRHIRTDRRDKQREQGNSDNCQGKRTKCHQEDMCGLL